MSHVNGRLAVTVLEGKELKKEDLIKNDPYVKVKVHNKILGKGQKTQVAKAGTNPKWGDTLVFDLKDTALTTKISFRVYDKDTLKDDKIGRADLTLNQLASHTGSEWLQLVNFHDVHKICGYILVSSKFEGSGWPTTGGVGSTGTGVGTGVGTGHHTGVGTGLGTGVGAGTGTGTGTGYDGGVGHTGVGHTGVGTGGGTGYGGTGVGHTGVGAGYGNTGGLGTALGTGIGTGLGTGLGTGHTGGVTGHTGGVHSYPQQGTTGLGSSGGYTGDGVGHTGLGTGVGHTGVGHTGVGHTGVGHTGVGHTGVGTGVGTGTGTGVGQDYVGQGGTGVGHHTGTGVGTGTTDPTTGTSGTHGTDHAGCLTGLKAALPGTKEHKAKKEAEHLTDTHGQEGRTPGTAAKDMATTDSYGRSDHQAKVETGGQGTGAQTGQHGGTTGVNTSTQI